MTLFYCCCFTKNRTVKGSSVKTVLSELSKDTFKVPWVGQPTAESQSPFRPLEPSQGATTSLLTMSYLYSAILLITRPSSNTLCIVFVLLLFTSTSSSNMKLQDLAFQHTKNRWANYVFVALFRYTV